MKCTRCRRECQVAFEGGGVLEAQVYYFNHHRAILCDDCVTDIVVEWYHRQDIWPPEPRTA